MKVGSYARVKAVDILSLSPLTLDELAQIMGMGGPIDTSDIPERLPNPQNRMFRDENGDIIPRDSDEHKARMEKMEMEMNGDDIIDALQFLPPDELDDVWLAAGDLLNKSECGDECDCVESLDSESIAMIVHHRETTERIDVLVEACKTFGGFGGLHDELVMVRRALKKELDAEYPQGGAK